ncbi:hypothetical protein Q4503_16425 [Colwellia sp. 6_MG-2023]|uniref:hypothetical protein n=1 Tax=Colwellia sp. 6_MG-2023 TaxID=3062676 RepID=UPI0026E27AC4|nr:hypothetical protein [Colwellia sp. 6_MG-2023]MDO6489282.1 hypothetical protein [Colwellia sp. 6_MG-2023]
MFKKEDIELVEKLTNEANKKLEEVGNIYKELNNLGVNPDYTTRGDFTGRYYLNCTLKIG